MRLVDVSDDVEHFVHIRLPWIGHQSVDYRRSLQHVVCRGFPTTTLRVIFTTSRAFSAKAKDVLADISKSHVVYDYRCRCERAYIGKTTQCLSERSKLHIPNKLLETPPVLRSAKTDSGISKHLRILSVFRRIAGKTSQS